MPFCKTMLGHGNKKRWFLYALFYLPLLYYLFFLQIQAIWPFTIDDMYISLRYAHHLAQGHGMLWNVGAPPVEGYSNFSFVMLGYLAIKMGWEPVFFLKALGVFGLWMSAIVQVALTRFFCSLEISMLAAIALLLYKGEIIWSVSGLETTVYQALLACSLFSLLKALGYTFAPSTEKRELGSLGWFVASAFFLTLASVTRPEGPIVGLLFLSLAFWDLPLEQRQRGRRLLTITLSLWSALLLPYYLWKVHFFGRIIPNPMYCKGMLATGLRLDKVYMKLAWPFFLLAACVKKRKKDKLVHYFYMPSLLYLLLLCKADPIVAFDNRLFLPAFSLLLVPALAGLVAVIAPFYKHRKEYAFLVLLPISVIFALFFLPMYSLTNYQDFTKSPIKGRELRKKVVSWLQEHVPANAKVVLGDAGLIPYYSDLFFIDSLCLNNREMTERVDDNMYQHLCHQLLRVKPEVIILISLVKKKEAYYTPTDSCLWHHLQKNPHYRLQQYYQTGNPGYRYQIYTKRGIHENSSKSGPT